MDRPSSGARTRMSANAGGKCGVDRAGGARPSPDFPTGPTLRRRRRAAELDALILKCAHHANQDVALDGFRIARLSSKSELNDQRIVGDSHDTLHLELFQDFETVVRIVL